jgi:hypothetical protein
MKKVFLLIIGVASFATMQAQTKFGVKAGANFANITGDDVDDTKIKVGINVGAFARFGLGDSWSLQPEVVFSTQGAKLDGGKYNLSYVNIPILAQYNFKGGFNVEAGPQIGFLTSAKAKPDEGDSEDIKDAFKSTDFALAFGAGYTTTANVGFNVRYNLGLGNIIDSDDAKAHNSVIQVGVFYLFGGK